VQPEALGPPPPTPVELLQGRMATLEALLEHITGERVPPPIAGGALESPPWVIAASQHSSDLFRQMPQSLIAATGVVGVGDLQVTANSPAAMNVLVAAGSVWMPGTIGGTTGFGTNSGAQTSVGNTNGGTSTATGFPTAFTRQANYFGYQDAQVTLSINSADPTNPRIDLICASVQDAEWAGSANQAFLQVVTGAAAASPSPTAPPANSVILASIWVPAAAGSIVTADINDLRPFAQDGLLGGGQAQGLSPVANGSNAVTWDAGRTDPLQNGVIGSGDLLVSAISINNAGAITFSTAGGTAWIKNTAGVLIRTAVAAQAGKVITPSSLPATGKYAVVGVEIDNTGTLHIDVKGADTATQLNTGSLIASNTPATTSGRLRIADIAVFNSSGTYQLGNNPSQSGSQGVNWIDRRPWARGGLWQTTVTAGNYTTSGGLAVIDSVRLSARMECTGALIRTRLTGVATHSVDGQWIDFALYEDGSAVSALRDEVSGNSTSSATSPSLLEALVTPSVGSHLFQPAWGTGGATATLAAATTYGLQFVIEEIVRQNSNNGTA
jgi:hypothetical protein